MPFLKTLSVSLSTLSFRWRLRITVLIFILCACANWIILPIAHSGTLVVIPILLAAWFFQYRGMLLCWCMTVFLILGTYTVMFGTILWPPPTALFTAIGLSSGLLIGLVVSYLRHTVDMIASARIKALHAEQAIEHQQQINSLKDQFLVNVNHELRTPLTTVYGYLDLLSNYREQLDTTMQAKFIDTAKESCDELIQLVNQVLDAMQISQEVEPPHLAVLSVAEIVQNALTYAYSETQSDYTIRVSIPENLYVLADSRYLHQVLIHLLSNAFKYAPKQTTVHIQAQGSPTEIRMCIKDEGPGIPPEDQALLFEKFVRLRRDLYGPLRGSGLGLYISKHLVQAMQGKIWIESSGRVGEGCCFYFTLPSSTGAQTQPGDKMQPHLR